MSLAKSLYIALTAAAMTASSLSIAQTAPAHPLHEGPSVGTPATEGCPCFIVQPGKFDYVPAK